MIKKVMKRKLLHKACAFVMLFCLLFSCFVNNSYAAEKRLVKVAFFPMEGFHMTKSDGTFGGMDVEYLNLICEYADWEVEYVECESWEQALELLSEHKVDLVGSAQYSEERAEIFQYADFSSGYTFGAIATNAEGTLAYEDFTAMKNATFGMVKNYVRKEEFLNYLRNNGIYGPKIVEYDSTADLQKALYQGEVDALVHTLTEIKQGQRIVGCFAPKPFYYITYKGNNEILQELNQALADLKMNQPSLESELMNKYYHSRFDKEILLNTEEKAYIEQNRSIVVGYVDGFYPFSYEENGEFKGITRQLFEEWIATDGFDPDYRKMDNLEEAKKALQSEEIDVLAYCTDAQETLDAQELIRVGEYANVPLVLVTEKGEGASEMKTLATVSYLSDEAQVAVNTGETLLKLYDTQQECLQAVKSGETEAALCDGYLVEYLLRTEIKYNNLQVTSVLSGEYSIAMAIKKGNESLEGILSKIITTVDSQIVNEFMLKENTYPLLSAKDFIYNNSIVIIVVLLAVIIVILLVANHIVNDEKKIQKLLYKDTQMDIWNLNYLIFYGENKLLQERREQYAVVYVNLAQFRRYNIIYGWDAGEKVLQRVAEILTLCVDQKREICARNQGDRFVMLLRYDEREQFIQRMEDMKIAVEDCIWVDTENHMILQMGVYFLPQNCNDLRVAISYANQVLEFAGNSATDAIKVYDDAHEAMIKERHAKEKLLESVIIEEDFAVYYQSKVDIRNEQIVGAEALVRFLDPTAGRAVRAPGYFISYYEQTGKVVEIDFFVLESVCKMLRRRIDNGQKVVCISCNFSRMHFMKEGFTSRFESILDKYQIPKSLIEVEITETLVVEEMQYQTVKQAFEALKARGIRLSIDDFGSGYSSLGTFEQIPASVIKLDRSFMLNNENKERQVKLMRGIVKIAQELDAQIVCEGVETDEDVELMREIGAFVAQGYYYFKPVSEATFEQQLGE